MPRNSTTIYKATLCYKKEVFLSKSMLYFPISSKISSSFCTLLLPICTLSNTWYYKVIFRHTMTFFTTPVTLLLFSPALSCFLPCFLECKHLSNLWVVPIYLSSYIIYLFCEIVSYGISSICHFCNHQRRDH